MTNHRKTFLLGIDGLPPAVFQRFVAEGRMPCFARLLERAALIDLVPTLPALTAPRWLTIASGAYPCTIGVANILLPIHGEAPSMIENGFDSRQSRAEYLWETLDRHGLRAIVLKYPGSWPPRRGNFIQVDGAGGYADISCRFEVAPSQAYVASDSGSVVDTSVELLFPTGYEAHWRTDTGPAKGLVEVVTRDPLGWRGISGDAKLVFEFALHIEQPGRRTRWVTHGLAYWYNGEAWLILSPNKDVKINSIRLRPGEWSDWIYADSSDGPYAYRFKLLGLDLDRRDFHLYRTQGHRLDGFTCPTELGDELIRETGPMVEWTGTYDLMNGLVDLETQFEIYEQHTNWMAEIIRYLGGTWPWHGFFTQWHVIEYAHHLVGASLHPEHPLHQQENVARDLDFLGRVYSLADRLLGAVEDVIDNQTLLVVASDHGHDLVHTIFYVNHFLRRHGWLVTTMQNSRTSIDWSQTAAYGLFPGCIYLNLAERWPGGIIKESDAGSLASAIAEAFRDLVDPRTGWHPIKLVLNREEMAVFGQAGDRSPDLFFCMERGYEPATRIRDGVHAETEFELTVPYKEVTSGHGSFFPPSLSVRTLGLLAGPGIHPGSCSGYPVSVMDLAPTMAKFLGVRAPRQYAGHAIEWKTN